MNRFSHLIELFDFVLLKSQVTFPVNYLNYRFVSTYKGDPGAKLCQMLLRYPETQLIHQDKHQKIFGSRD